MLRQGDPIATLAEALSQAVEAATLAERERCAKIAEAESEPTRSTAPEWARHADPIEVAIVTVRVTKANIAAAIRKGESEV
jgi:hypothetical protein